MSSTSLFKSRQKTVPVALAIPTAGKKSFFIMEQKYSM